MTTRTTDLLLLDGRHLLWRTSDAFSQLSAVVDGEAMGTGGIYGFLGCALRTWRKYQGKVVVCWEGSGNFRHKLYPEYKQKRARSPAEQDIISDMGLQEEALKDLLEIAGIDQHAGAGCEADDVIGTLAGAAWAAGKKVVIYSGDSDLRQLVRDDSARGGSIVAASPGRVKDALFREADVLEKHGVIPRLIPDLKALAGDVSDNIPGAHGVGPKTAIQLVNHYGDLAAVLEAAEKGDEHWPVAPRHRDVIKASADSLRLFLKLTRIRVRARMDSRPGRRDSKALMEGLRRYKFASLAMPYEFDGLNRMGSEP